MQSNSEDEALVGFAMATFQVALLLLVAVIYIHLGSGLAGSLGKLSTAIGIGTFLVLWSSTAYCSWKATREIGLAHTDVPLGELITIGGNWAVRNGITIFVAPLLLVIPVVTIETLFQGGPVQMIGVLFIAVFIAAIGAGFAGIVGYVVGMVGVLVVALLWGLAYQATAGFRRYDKLPERL